VNQRTKEKDDEIRAQYKVIKDFVEKTQSYPQIYSSSYSLDKIDMHILDDPDDPLIFNIPDKVGNAVVVTHHHKIEIPEDRIYMLKIDDLTLDNYTNIEHDLNLHVKTCFLRPIKILEYSGSSRPKFLWTGNELTLTYIYSPPNALCLGNGLSRSFLIPFMATEIKLVVKTVRIPPSYTGKIEI
jgi:hypothetical protein